MAIRLSGMASGLDTEQIVGALVSAYSYKKEKYVKSQTKLSWKQDAWKELNTKVMSFYKQAGSMRTSDAYSARKSTISDSTKATIIAGKDAINGTQTLQIKKLAKAGYITGADLTQTVNGVKTTFTKDSKLVDLGYTYKNNNGRIDVTAGGKTTSIQVNAQTTIEEFTKQLNDAGVSANFDEKTQRFFVSAKETGSENDFKISGGNAAGIQAISVMGLYSSADISGFTDYKSLATIDGGEYDPDATYASVKDHIKAIKSAYYTLQDKDASSSEKTAAQAVIDDEDNKKWIKFMDMSAEDWVSRTSDDIVSESMTKLDAAVKMAGGITIKSGNSYEQAASIAQKDIAGVFNADDTSLYIDSAVNGLKQKYSDYMKLKDTDPAAAAAKKAEIDTLYDTRPDLMEVIASATGMSIAKSTDANFDTVASSWNSLTSAEADNLTKKTLNYVEMANTINSDTFDYNPNLMANRVAGEDAEIVLNGATFTDSSNNFSVNGLTIQCTETTQNADGTFNTLTITTGTDTSGLYDTIKNFLNGYNNLINELCKLYNADSSKGYEPLTDDEKAEMSDTQIEKWEQKIKDSLFRRDNTVDSIISLMSTSMMKSYEINGKSYSLSSFGISTLGYLNATKNENYAYHIDGDSEDTNTSSKQDKLKAALAEDPDSVIEFMKQLTSGLYKELDKKMKTTAVSSVYTVYNDKEMASEYSDYTSLIKTWTKRISDMEDAYYKKFSSMEAALAKIQGSSSSISSLLG